jgi:glutathione S-transferase
MEKIRSRVRADRASCSGMKLYRLRYSSFARKVQMLLDLLGHQYQLVEIDYGQRNELAELTGGYIYVPVLVADDGTVITESRRICERLLTGAAARELVPAPLEGPIWAYADFCDGVLEDVLFRIATPVVRDTWPSAWERALYTLTKERKFGTGCVEAWLKDQPALLERARHLLTPTLTTLEQQPFLFGVRPTLADAALYGNLVMLSEAEPALLRSLSPGLVGYAQRLEAARPKREAHDRP